MNYSFLPEAEAEYLAAICFYEEQQAGLGDALITEFERILILAVEKPEAWRLVHQSGIRCIRLSRFPYVVFFRMLSDNLQVTAFAHHRRRPGYWLTRVDRTVGSL
ncbi:MAG: type II toxin-antitoxin system RelE/ParE family toxin [Methylovulum sp.]|nr:MAG: type II toxin-antitoxin system RelE/ParE family toxin [Methylovulum sp.]